MSDVDAFGSAEEFEAFQNDDTQELWEADVVEPPTNWSPDRKVVAGATTSLISVLVTWWFNEVGVIPEDVQTAALALVPPLVFSLVAYFTPEGGNK